MNCHKGGFVNARHDNIRNTEYNLLKSLLQKVENVENYPRSAIITDEARLDIRARGFWRTGQNAFFDVRITNPNCDSQRNMTLKSITRKHELEKKRNYNKRVMEVEHGSFTPLVFTTSGVMGHECSIYHKSLAQKISDKRKEKYEDIIRYLRIKLSFLAVKATLLCLRGSRSRTNNTDATEDFTYSLNELGL